MDVTAIRASPTLLEREDVLRELYGVLDSARTGTGRLAIVEGSAGTA